MNYQKRVNRIPHPARSGYGVLASFRPVGEPCITLKFHGVDNRTMKGGAGWE